MSRFLQDLAIVAFMVAILLTVPPHIQQQLAPDVPAANAKPRLAEPMPAPIWSKRCERDGKTMMAHQADGGPWVIHCTGKALRT